MSSKKFWIKTARRKPQLLSCLQRNQKLDFKWLIQPESITKCCRKSVTLIFLIFSLLRRQFTTSSRLCPSLRSKDQRHQSARNNLSNLLRKWQRWVKFTQAEVLRTKTISTASSWRSTIDLPDSASAWACISKLTWWLNSWIMKWARLRPMFCRNRHITGRLCRRHSYLFSTIWRRP